METMNLYAAIEKNTGAQAPALLKHLGASGIHDWEDLSKANLMAFKDRLNESVCDSSAKTYCAVLRAFLNRYEEEGLFPCKKYEDILKQRGEKPLKTYLTPEELGMLERVETRTNTERFVLYQFLVSSYTGCRISDTRMLTSENITNGYLTYVSLKTGVHATIPCKPELAEWIEWLNGSQESVSLVWFDKTIKKLAKRAGINERVKIYHAGKEAIKEKWQCLSSHSARISLCTNLANAGVPLLDIARLAGHTSTTMTERYCVPTGVKLDDKAMAYFK